MKPAKLRGTLTIEPATPTQPLVVVFRADRVATKVPARKRRRKREST